jgi:hypothetical protein
MGLVRHREGTWFVVLVAVVVLGSVLAWYVGSRDDAGGSAHATDRPTNQSPETAGPKRKKKAKGDASAEPQAATDAPGAGWAGNGELPPGLGGDGGGVDIPRFALRVTVTSSEAIRTVGLQVPTSDSHKSRVYQGVGTSWSVQTRVYGKPDYARVFLQAGPSGAAITCVITVDGRVTERRSTSGPYGATMCQG